MWGHLRGAGVGGAQIHENPPGFHPGFSQSCINTSGWSPWRLQTPQIFVCRDFPKNQRWDFLCPALQTDKYWEFTNNIQNERTAHIPNTGIPALELFKSLIPYSGFAPRRSCCTKVENLSFPGRFHHIPAHSSCREIKLNSFHRHSGAPGVSQKTTSTSQLRILGIL